MGTWYRVTFLRLEYSLQRPVETQFHGESFETLQVRRFPSSLTAIDRLTVAIEWKNSATREVRNSRRFVVGTSCATCLNMYAAMHLKDAF